jgi:AcrR family transcriptional regulator
MAVTDARMSTRERLEAAAVRMFGESGFDGVRVVDIARAAGVTERTFFRHFGSKEDVLLANHTPMLALLCERISAPVDGTLEERVCSALDAIASTTALDPLAVVRARLLLTTASLRERSFTLQSEWEAAIEEVATSSGESRLEARVLAAASIAAFRVTVEEWADGATNSDLQPLMTRALRRLFPAVYE